MVKSELLKFFADPWTSLGLVGAIIVSFKFLSLGQAGIIIAMASFSGQEYTNSTLRTTLLCNPQRCQVLLVKESVMIGTITVTALLRGITKPTIILSWIFMGLIAGNLTIIFKSPLIPITVLFSLVLGLSQMILAFTTLARFLPDLAVMNLMQAKSQKIFLDPVTGIMVEALWLALISLIAFGRFLKRDQI